MSTKDKGSGGGEIVATDLIVRADAHFVGTEIHAATYKAETTSQNDELTTSI